ncbi:MAG: histidine phosphatase family protein [Spirochaetaceae bacterium]|nr:histidine phosphatase family protein [Spirochaetaceae bacterium]
MVELYLIRHGECEGSGSYIGRGSNVPLTKKGNTQIRNMALFLRESLSGEKIDFLYTSPMSRAVESAEILAEELQSSYVELKGLEEVDFGDWEGLTYEEIDKNNHRELQQWISHPIEKSPPHGESLKELQFRVLQALSPLMEKIDDEKTWRIASVSHRGPLAVLIAHLLKLDLNYFWNFKIDRGSVSLLSLFPEFNELSFLNRKF